MGAPLSGGYCPKIMYLLHAETTASDAVTAKMELTFFLGSFYFILK